MGRYRTSLGGGGRGLAMSGFGGRYRVLLLPLAGEGTIGLLPSRGGVCFAGVRGGVGSRERECEVWRVGEDVYGSYDSGGV